MISFQIDKPRGALIDTYKIFTFNASSCSIIFTVCLQFYLVNLVLESQVIGIVLFWYFPKDVIIEKKKPTIIPQKKKKFYDFQLNHFQYYITRCEENRNKTNLERERIRLGLLIKIISLVQSLVIFFQSKQL